MSAVTEMIGLRTSDHQILWVEPVIVSESLTIKSEVDQVGTGKVIDVRLPRSILEKVLEYCKEHVKEPKDPDEIKSWDNNFITVNDYRLFFDLLWAAKFLKIQGLLDLACHAIKYKIEGKSSDEIIALSNMRPC